MFLRPQESLRLSKYSLRYILFSNCKDLYITHCANLRSSSGGRRKVAEVPENESSPSVAGEFSVCVPPKKINDNFYGIESEEGVVTINSKPTLKNSSTRQLFNNAEQEKFIGTSFGTVRYDSDNKPKHHGQLEKEKVLVSANVDKDRIRNLNQTLMKKNSVKNHNLSLGMEKNSEITTDACHKESSSKSKLPSSSYVDEIYFPDSYTENEGNISNLKGSSPSTNDTTLNFIDESYFILNITSVPNFKEANLTSGNICVSSLPDQEKATEKNTDNKLPSFQTISELKSSSSNNNKSNFNESYLRDSITSVPIFKEANLTSGNICDSSLPDQEKATEKNTDKLPSFQSISELKSSSSSSNDNKSNFIEESFFKDEMADDSIFKNVNMTSENIGSIDNSHPFLFNENTEEFIAYDKQSSFSSRDTKFSTENFFNVHETETNMKTLHNLNESGEEINADDNGEKLSLKLNYPSVEDLEGYNKFISGATDLPKKKNNFSFQNKEFLKQSEGINSKSSSRVKKLQSFQRNQDKTDTAEKTQKEEEVDKGLLETQNSKIAKEVKNFNDQEQPESAYDFVKKLRSTKKKLNPELINGKFIPKNTEVDSKGFRILKNQVPDLKYYTNDEIVELLVKNVIYSDDDLIVLNKPYNLVMHESKTTKDPCLSQYLDDLAAELDRKTYKPKLITVHRLDKETSGCLLLARNEISAHRLLSFFSQRKIIKTYWIVTTRVPDPLEGVIDMPISEGSVNGRARMVLHPDLPKDIPYKNHSKSGKRAVTHYKVIAESGNAALVEAKPETGIKHQIRVHFGFGLSCPILGDHKYSHLDKLAPQKLQSDLLQRLHVRQSKVRYIPMHMYARSIFIPQYKDGRNLFVMAPMPIHMSQNLQKLKFRKK